MFKFVHSIRFRVWLLFIGFTSAILIFLYINQVLMLPVFYDFMKTQESIATANILKRNFETDNFKSEIERLSSEQNMRIQVDVFIEDNEVPVTIISDNGSFDMYSSSVIINDELYKGILNSKTGIITQKANINTTGRSYLILATLVGTKSDVKGYIIIFNYLEPLVNVRNILKSQFFMNAAVVLCVAFLLSAFVVIRISNPIIKISRSARKLPIGEFNMKVLPSDYAEIKILTENLNKASTEIAKTENLRKDLIANVSHDLKTPLTMIKAYAEMIRDLSGDNPEKRLKHLQVIVEEADRLNGLVIDMLDLSKLQSGVAVKKTAEFDFSEHIAEIVSRFMYLTETEKYDINSEIEDDIYIIADIPKIEQVVYNLINNAVNYTGDDGKIMTRLYRKTPVKGRFEVSDTGKGIAAEEIPYIWERYYKAEKSEFHQRTTVGTGLGLSIVKGVLDMHGFAYGVDSTVGIGSTFWFEFPCSPK